MNIPETEEHVPSSGKNIHGVVSPLTVGHPAPRSIRLQTMAIYHDTDVTLASLTSSEQCGRVTTFPFL